MDIGAAVKLLNEGRRVHRTGWNGRGMWLTLITEWEVNPRESHERAIQSHLPFVAMRTVQGDLVPWLCSQTDLLAVDWEAV